LAIITIIIANILHVLVACGSVFCHYKALSLWHAIKLSTDLGTSDIIAYRLISLTQHYLFVAVAATLHLRTVSYKQI